MAKKSGKSVTHNHRWLRVPATTDTCAEYAQTPPAALPGWPALLLSDATLSIAARSPRSVIANAPFSGVRLNLTHHCDIVETGNESWRFNNRA